jgi:hypothetical protein
MKEISFSQKTKVHKKVVGELKKFQLTDDHMHVRCRSCFGAEYAARWSSGSSNWLHIRSLNWRERLPFDAPESACAGQLFLQ